MVHSDSKAPPLCSGCFSFAEILTRKYNLPYQEELSVMFSKYGYSMVKVLFERIVQELDKQAEPDIPSVRGLERIFENYIKMKSSKISIKYTKDAYKVFKHCHVNKIKNLDNYAQSHLNPKQLEVTQELGGPLMCVKLTSEGEENFSKVFCERLLSLSKRPVRKSTSDFTTEGV